MKLPKIGSDLQPEQQGVMKEYFDQHLNCRVYGHSWHDRTGYHITEETLQAVIAEDTVTCLTCGTSRRDSVKITTTRVERLTRSYHYPVNYLTPGMGLKRSDFLSAQVYRDLSGHRRGS